jgi:hypothetical protein
MRVKPDIIIGFLGGPAFRIIGRAHSTTAPAVVVMPAIVVIRKYSFAATAASPVIRMVNA